MLTKEEDDLFAAFLSFESNLAGESDEAGKKGFFAVVTDFLFDGFDRFSFGFAASLFACFGGVKDINHVETMIAYFDEWWLEIGD